MAKKHHGGQQKASGSAAHGKAQDKKRKPGGINGRSTLIWIGVGIMLIAAAGFVLMRPQQALASEVTPAQAYDEYKAGAFFLDVRTQAEWDLGRIPKSRLIPLDELPNRLSEVPRDKNVVVVCRSGARSKEGAVILRQAGFTRVTCLSGGLLAWQAAGYPVEK